MVLCYMSISGQKSLALNRFISTRIKHFRGLFHDSDHSFRSAAVRCQTECFHNYHCNPFTCISFSGFFYSSNAEITFQNGACRRYNTSSNVFFKNGKLFSHLSVNRNKKCCISNQIHFQSSKSIHTSRCLNVLLPPHVWILLKPAQKLFAIIVGRSVRKWWRALPTNKQELFKENVKRNKWKLALSIGALGIVFVLFYSTHLEESPITGRSRLLIFRKEHYDFLTKLEYESMIEEFKDIMLSKEDSRYQHVQRIVDLLISSNSDLPGVFETEWVVHVVENPDINACALPNGQIFVFTGLLEAALDAHQLSFILGHEMAHALLEHTAEMNSVSHFLDFFFLVSLVIIWAICPVDSLAIMGQWIQSTLKKYMFDRPYSRTLEAEADQVGLQLVAKACVDVRASSVFWKQMEVLGTLSKDTPIPEWLSTHPSHENRADHLDRLIPEAIKLRESCNCPALPFPDPREVFNLTAKQLLQAPENAITANK